MSGCLRDVWKALSVQSSAPSGGMGVFAFKVSEFIEECGKGVLLGILGCLMWGRRGASRV